MLDSQTTAYGVCLLLCPAPQKDERPERRLPHGSRKVGRGESRILGKLARPAKIGSWGLNVTATLQSHWKLWLAKGLASLLWAPSGKSAVAAVNSRSRLSLGAI